MKNNFKRQILTYDFKMTSKEQFDDILVTIKTNPDSFDPEKLILVNSAISSLAKWV